MTSRVEVNPGDIVRVIAPAGKGAESNLPNIRAYIESLQLVPLIKDDIYDPDEPLYSNSDEFRGQDLLEALLDEECKVIWCIRGGSGSMRLIPFLEANLPVTPAPSAKILIGYSDITVLHAYLQHKYNWPTIHGLMLEAIGGGSFDPDEESVTLLTSLIFNQISSVCEPPLTRIDSGVGTDLISGPVVGGNLTLVEASIGTLWAVESLEKIIFLEDTGEAAYSVERSLDHMKQAGKFQGALAVVFGDFTNPDNSSLIDLVLQRFTDDPLVTCPVFRLTGIGHGSVNFPLPLNTFADIESINPETREYRMCVSNLPVKT